MKKLLIIASVFYSFFALSTPTASAMTVSAPSGTKIGEWYKDSFSVTIRHGTPTCVGVGTTYSYVYTSTNSGTHGYAFYSDIKDNPYLRLDSGGYIELNRKCTANPNNSTFVHQFTASVDSKAPTVSISNPGSGSTAAGSVTVSGTAGDSEGNLQSVQAKVNGVLGPTASISGNTYSVSVPLNNGSNSIQIIAKDSVGHSTDSNTITITRGTSTSGSGSRSASGSTGGTSATNGNTSNKSGTASKSNASSTSGGSISSEPGSDDDTIDYQGPISVNPNAGVEASNPADIQQQAAVAGATGISLIALLAVVAILLALCGYIFFRYRPDKPGLRRRIIVVVILPSLVPLIGLSLLGYQQLSDSVKNQLSDQLQKAADATAVKLDREFAIRRSVIKQTASNVLQVKNQYEARLNQLAATATASRANLTAQENDRVNEQLNSVRGLFGDVEEMVVVDSTPEANIKATLARADDSSQSIATAHKELLASAATSDLALYKETNGKRQLLLTIPIKNNGASIGGVVVAINTNHRAFVPNILQATPKAYTTDKAYIIAANGTLVSPESRDNDLKAQLKPLAKAKPSTRYTLTAENDTYTVRTATVSSVKWVVAVGTPSSSVLAPIAGLQRTALLAIAGFILLSFFLGAWFANRIAAEVRLLYDGALKFAKGNLDHRIEVDSKDELQVLGDTLNQMAADIKTAQEALIEKDKEFIHVASHELKAPMTVIIGYMSMIVENGLDKLDKDTQGMFREVYNGTVSLRDLIIDLLDVARMESGRSEFKLEPVDVSAAATAVIEMQKLPAQQAEITLVHEAGAKPLTAIADKSKLQIVLTNFVTNAIKYNRKGGTVTVGHELKDGQLVISVADTGLGIPDDQKAHMFEKFYRVKHEDRAAVPGTGLGMYITKQYIENMGGKVWFESVHGKGTTFYFSLPLKKEIIGSENSVDLETTQNIEPK